VRHINGVINKRMKCTKTEKCPFFEDGAEQCVYEALADGTFGSRGVDAEKE
jgi:hypothetical protein